MKNTLLILLIILGVVACKKKDSVGPAPLKHLFDTNNQGWKIAGDAQNNSVEPTYKSTGGNPGGFISATDDVAGGVWYFSAPSDFMSAMKNRYGQTLSFDLIQSSTASQFNSADVLLESSNQLLILDLPSNPGTTWTSYSVKLDETGGWKKNGNAATKAEIEEALTSLTRLWIRGEYVTGADTGGLDNPGVQ